MRLIPILWAVFWVLCASPLEETRVLSQRLNDSLEIQGKDLQGLQGKSLASLELLTVKSHRLAPIPFQVDERVATGKGRLEWALPVAKADQKITDDGLLDADDELVFMAMDLGPRADRKSLRALSSPAMEIQVTDPLTGERGYAYLDAASGAPRRSEKDYVRYDAGTDYIETPVYTLGHSRDFPIAHNENRVKREAGGGGVDFLDIFKQRLFASMLFGTVKINKTAKDWTSGVFAYKDGPVRVIRRNENQIHIAGNLKSPRLYTVSFYLRDTFWLPGELNIPFKLSIFFTKVKMEWANDLSHHAVGMMYFSNAAPQGVLIDGLMSPEERHIPSVDHEWQMIAGPQGVLLTRAILGPRARDIPHRVTYRDDARTPDPPEDEPGMYGRAGFALTELEKQEGGVYTSAAYNYFRGEYNPGDERRLLNILDHPLQVKTRALPLEKTTGR